MKKSFYLSFACALALHASTLELSQIDVEDTIDTQRVEDVSGEALRSGDLGESLTKASASIQLSRRSGIANDIVLRGQKRDNINVTIDGARLYGGCPNRMDPPISHVVTNMIESVSVDEGPYDVENFGTLSGLVQVHTKAPSKEFQGEVNLNAGSFGYKKGSLSASGGNDTIKVLFSASKESSEQYKDGNGDTFSEQLKTSNAPASNRYQSAYEDRNAYEKTSYMGKVFVNVAENQELRVSYTANRSDNVLYPTSPMDADRDDSDLFNVGYTITNLTPYSKKLDFFYYNTSVEHPMSTRYRKNALGGAGIVTNDMESKVEGLRVKNDFDTDFASFMLGVDVSDRTWKGQYYKQDETVILNASIDNAQTKNRAIFAQVAKSVANIDYNFGMRYDSTKSSSDNITEQDNTYHSLNANLFTTYHMNDSLEYFLGFGKSSRVPDGRELYFRSKDLSGATTGTQNGTPNLKQITNYEVDLGFRKTYENAYLKGKLFYSDLKNYIYFTTTAPNNFQNIDASIYGMELGGSYFVNDVLSFDGTMSYQKGKKKEALAGQSDTDLADMAPLRATLSANIEYNRDTTLKIDWMLSREWKRIDSDNGEQKLPGYGVINTKLDHALSKDVTLSVGVDNVFDKTYTTSNTYNDLTLLTSGGTQKILMNEPGRYGYVNINYKF